MAAKVGGFTAAPVNMNSKNLLSPAPHKFKFFKLFKLFKPFARAPQTTARTDDLGWLYR